MSTALTRDHDLSLDAETLLRAGASHKLGLVCMPGQVSKNFAALREAERLGYLLFLNIEQPWITPAGRAAIGAPTEAEADRERFAQLVSGIRKPLVPTKRDDPRTDFDYRSYQSMDYACVLVVKQPDYRTDPPTLRVGRSLTSEPRYLGSNNSILLPESKGRFALALMPRWLVERTGLPTYPLPLDETDSAWTDDERATWETLRKVCFSVNSRIRNANRRPTQRLRFGETA